MRFLWVECSCTSERLMSASRSAARVVNPALGCLARTLRGVGRQRRPVVAQPRGTGRTSEGEMDGADRSAVVPPPRSGTNLQRKAGRRAVSRKTRRRRPGRSWLRVAPAAVVTAPSKGSADRQVEQTRTCDDDGNAWAAAQWFQVGQPPFDAQRVQRPRLLTCWREPDDDHIQERRG